MEKSNSGGSQFSAYLQRLNQFYQNEEVKTYFNLVLSLLAISFFIAFAIRPTLTTIAALAKEEKDQQEVAERLSKKLENLAEARKEMLAIKPRLDQVESALPDSPQAVLFLGQLEVLANENHLQRDSSQAKVNRPVKKSNEEDAGDQKKAEAGSSIQAEVIFSGNWENTENFLKELKKLRRFNQIETLGIKKARGQGDSLTLTLSLKAFYLEKDAE